MADKINTEGLLSLEQALLKVPLETLKRDFRLSQRLVERDMAFVVSDAPPASKIARLETLKRKLQDSQVEKILQSTKDRIAHLKEVAEMTLASSDEFARWAKIRFDCLI